MELFEVFDSVALEVDSLEVEDRILKREGRKVMAIVACNHTRIIGISRSTGMSTILILLPVVTSAFHSKAFSLIVVVVIRIIIVAIVEVVIKVVIVLKDSLERASLQADLLSLGS